MDLPLLLALFASALIVAYLIFAQISKNKAAPAPAVVQPAQNVAQNPAPRAARRTGGALDRMANVRQRRPNAVEDDTPAANDTGSDEEEEAGQQKKIGKKKQLKLELKEEKRKQREAEEEARAKRKEQEDEEWEEQQKLKAKEAEEEKQREAEEKRKRVEKEKQEEEEYQQWKQMMAVEQAGTIQAEKEEREKRMDEFVELVTKKKVVVLEELALEFNMKTMEVIEQLEKFDREGRLSGVIDDRGKFIYITRGEMEKVSAFIHRKGRVSIEDIQTESNRLINLNPASE